jgi:HEAT repeat protein
MLPVVATILWLGGLEQGTAIDPLKAGSSQVVQELDIAGDLQTLERAKISSDAAGLLDFIRKCTPKPDVDPTKVQELVRQLGSNRFEEREQASRDLITVGFPALRFLRPALIGVDPEVARRARHCAQGIGKGPNAGLVAAGVRVLAERRILEGAEALLAFLPYADDESLEEEIWYALDRLTAGDRRRLGMLEKALTNAHPARRSVAACVLGRRGNDGQKALVRQLLADNDPMVCLRAAQGLLAGKDLAGVPALVKLLRQESVDITWQAEELLNWIAGDDAPKATVGSGTPDERTKCHQAWEEWLKRNAKSLNWERAHQSSRRPGLVLTLSSPVRGKGWAGLYGCNSISRWSVNGLERATGIHLLPGNRVLLEEERSSLRVRRAPGRISERDLSGKILWQHMLPGFLAGSSRRLEDGNTYAGTENGWVEITPQNEEIRIEKLGKAPWSYVGRKKLGNGNILAHVPGQGSMLELDPLTAAIVKRNPIVGHRFGASYGMLEPLPGGHRLMIVPFVHYRQPEGPITWQSQAEGREGRLLELDTVGRVVWRQTITGPESGNGLRNGNFMVGCRFPDGLHVAEINRAGEAVWEAIPGGEDATCQSSVCLSLLRFGFDSVRGPLKESERIGLRIRLMKDPNPGIRQAAAYSLQEFGPRAEPALPALIDLLADPEQDVCYRAGLTLWTIGPASVPLLSKALQSPNANLRANAALRIWKFQESSEDILQALIGLLKDDSPLVRTHTLAAIRCLGPRARRAVPAIIAGLDDPEADQDKRTVRGEAIMALVEIGGEISAAVPGLVKAVKDKDTNVQIQALKALGGLALKDERVTDALIWAVDKNLETHVRAEAALAIGMIGPSAKKAIPTLREILKDPDAPLVMQYAVVNALGKMGTAAKDAIPDLMGLSGRVTDTGLQEAIRQSIQTINGQE